MALGPRVGQHRGGGQVLDPPGPGELVHVGGDPVDDRGHPRQVDGHDLVTVADMLGHARLDTVRLYTHPTVADRERALNLLPHDR